MLRCKCICIGKPCFCREHKSFYSLVPIESAFWCTLSAFTFSASLPLNECLWITFPAISQFLVYLFSSFVCPGFPSFWFTYSTVLYVQGSKKKLPSRTRVFETWVLWKIKGKIFSPVELESLKLEFYWGNFFPLMLCLGREPTKTEH